MRRARGGVFCEENQERPAIRSGRGGPATRTAASCAARAASTSSTRPTRASRPVRAKRRSRLCYPGGGGPRLPPLFHLAYERGMQMPPLDPAILARRSEIVAALRAVVPGEV